MRSFLALCAILWTTAAVAQIPTPPECALARQTPAPSAAPQVTFLQDPKPIVFEGRSAQFTITARLVSVRPLAFDILDVEPAMQREAAGLCAVITIPAADAKLRPLLAKAVFNQVFRLSLFFGGTLQAPQVVLSTLTPAAVPAAGLCPNSTGIVLSYHGVVEYLNVYNDGSLFYQDAHFNTFGTQKLAQTELADTLRAFAGARFDALPSTPAAGAPDRNALTLVCARHQRVALTGREPALVDLLPRMEALKARATSQAYYLLVTEGRRRLTILDWPFSDIHLRDIADRRKNGVSLPPAIHDTVPAGFLAKLPQDRLAGSPAPPADPNIYVAEAGALYRVVRPPCYGPQPRCSAFEHLDVRPVLPAPPDLYAPGGLLWPAGLRIALAAVGPEGRRIADDEFQRQPVYKKLHEFSAGGMGYSFVEGGYAYDHVRICRVDPKAPPSACLKPPSRR